ncbi:MAG: nuclear transport factor 2 family protein [Chloroflexota bacterium]|nr:nuclear transport factor 2 family protein [Chloroflexota bacterium]
MASKEEITATIAAHVAAVGAADADAVAALYGADAELQDPAGTTVAVGRSAIRRHFAAVLTAPREMQLVFVAVTDHRPAVHFRATPAGGATRDVTDTMTFDEHAAITSMHAHAG